MPRLLGIEEYPRSSDKCERSRPVLNWFGRYNNPWPDTWATPNIMLLYRWKAKYPKSKLEIPSEEALDKLLPVMKPTFCSSTKANNDVSTDPSSSLPIRPHHPMALTWLGHATCLLEMDGISILTDPVFSPHCATFQAVSFGGSPGTTPRFRPAPCSVEDLPDNVRFILISHNHFDHMDAPSCQALAKRFGSKITWCVPKGNAYQVKSMLHQNVTTTTNDNEDNSDNINSQAVVSVVELDWWQSAAFKVDDVDDDDDCKNNKKKPSSSFPLLLFEIVSTPCQHWCMRSLWDKMASLWCSWAVIGPSGRRFFFGGDTGYCKAFKEIGTELGPFDLAALPIGAYDPHEFLSAQHIDPGEAVKVHQDIRARRSVGIHWGTFPFADDALMAPKEELEAAVAKYRLPSDEFVTLKHGETLTL